MNVLEQLRIPFSAEQIRWRIGNKSKNKDKATALAYIDARDVMDRLDQVVGPENWQDDYIAEPPRTVRKKDKYNNQYYNEQICGRVMCKLSVRIGDEWITKSDAAGETNVEGEKGGFSDAFKRAAVKFGIGRDLYSIESRYYPINQYGKFEQTPQLPPHYLNKRNQMIAKYKAFKQEQQQWA